MSEEWRSRRVDDRKSNDSIERSRGVDVDHERQKEQ